jgi:signal transduction histidine kinase
MGSDTNHPLDHSIAEVAEVVAVVVAVVAVTPLAMNLGSLKSELVNFRYRSHCFGCGGMPLLPFCV